MERKIEQYLQNHGITIDLAPAFQEADDMHALSHPGIHKPLGSMLIRRAVLTKIKQLAPIINADTPLSTLHTDHIRECIDELLSKENADEVDNAIQVTLVSVCEHVSNVVWEDIFQTNAHDAQESFEDGRFSRTFDPIYDVTRNELGMPAPPSASDIDAAFTDFYKQE
mgnify:FL=1|jgi:hypothetical protein